MSLINVFGGHGFVGGWFHSSYPETVLSPKYNYTPKTNNILSFISTVDNYNLSRNLPYKDVRSNIITMLYILEDARALYGKDFTFNFISSWFVYGKIKEFPAQESSECNPTGFYSITKRAAEQLLISYCETYGIKYRILRLANVLGVGDEKVSAKKNATQFMIRELVQGRPIQLYQGRFLRDFIDVRDVVSAIRAIVDFGDTNEIYNVGSGVGTAICDIIQYVSERFPNSMIRTIDVPVFHKQVQVENMYLDTTKLSKLYIPKYSTYETVDWLIENYKEK